jgi:hypothetical protein
MLTLSHFTCDGPDTDSPEEGWEVVESDVPEFPKGEFLVGLQDILDSGVEFHVQEDTFWD